MSRSAHLLPPIGPTPWGTNEPTQDPHVAPSPQSKAPEITLPWAPGYQARGQHPAKDVEHPAAWAHAPITPQVVLEDQVSLAVALDLLATAVAPLAPTTTILAGFTDALLALRETHLSEAGLAGAQAESVGAALRELALGPVGEARSRVAEGLSACTQALGYAPSTSEGVHLACRLLVDGAKQVVHQARLALDAQARSQAWRP